MEQIKYTALNIFDQLPLFVVAIVILWVGKVVFDITTKYEFDEQLCEKDNPALGVTLAGYLIGIGLALKGAFAGVVSNPDVLVETAADGTVTEFTSSPLVEIGINGVLVIILMRLSIWVSDKCILHKFKVEKEIIDDQNSGTGFVVAGSCVATGLMLCGVLSGTSASYTEMIRDIAIYWGVGQLLLIIGAKLYTIATRYDVHKTIEDDDNVSAGICFGAYLVAQGIIAYSSLSGASGALANEITVTAVAGLTGMILLVCSSIIVDKIFLPKADLAKEIQVDKNIAAGATAAAVFVTVGTVLSSIISASI
jgi:uncharacterized membrane protein YjfL (UPF0719 family)